MTEDIAFWLPYIRVNNVVVEAIEDRHRLLIQLQFSVTTIGANLVINILLNENSLLVTETLPATITQQLVQTGTVGSATAFGGAGGAGY